MKAKILNSISGNKIVMIEFSNERIHEVMEKLSSVGFNVEISKCNL
jgi:hypothetical protein